MKKSKRAIRTEVNGRALEFYVVELVSGGVALHMKPVDGGHWGKSYKICDIDSEGKLRRAHNIPSGLGIKVDAEGRIKKNEACALWLA